MTAKTNEDIVCPKCKKIAIWRSGKYDKSFNQYVCYDCHSVIEIYMQNPDEY